MTGAGVGVGAGVWVAVGIAVGIGVKVLIIPENWVDKLQAVVVNNNKVNITKASFFIFTFVNLRTI